MPAEIHAKSAGNCTCGGPWPCLWVGYLTEYGKQRLRARIDPMGGSVSMCPCCTECRVPHPSRPSTWCHEPKSHDGKHRDFEVTW